MGAIKPSKMPKPKKKARRDNTNFTQYKEGGKVNAAGNYTKPEQPFGGRGGGGGGGMMPDLEGLKGRRPKLYKKGGAVKSASSRADGIAQRGKTRGMMK
jgi:hypothetical protein